MLKKAIIASFFLVCLSINAQEFQGKAEYFSKRVLDKKSEKIESDSKEPMDPELEKAVQDAMKKASEKKYVLNFSKTESVYEQPQELEQPENASSGISVKIQFSGEGKKYMNLKDKIYIEEADIFGKEFLIEEKLTVFNWTLSNETKKIGDYTCNKAEVVIPVSEKEKQDYKEYLEKSEKKNKSGLFEMKEPKDRVVTAWYTTEIPISFGPNMYWGLPGLILEINDEDTIVLCSKVTLNTKEKAKMKAPNTGKKVTQKEFDKIQKEKFDSMKDQDGNVIFQTTE
jgi:GLPGLI family protein